MGSFVIYLNLHGCKMDNNPRHLTNALPQVLFLFCIISLFYSLFLFIFFTASLTTVVLADFTRLISNVKSTCKRRQYTNVSKSIIIYSYPFIFSLYFSCLLYHSYVYIYVQYIDICIQIIYTYIYNICSMYIISRVEYKIFFPSFHNENYK